MTTYTYTPGVGVISATDPNGISTYYEYDFFWRLKNVRDKDKQIIKNFSYGYKAHSGPQ
jgi:YD repeat-containing protein